jgi:hypothetical protein
MALSLPDYGMLVTRERQALVNAGVDAILLIRSGHSRRCQYVAEINKFLI